jgi:hypothetical protein
MWLDEDMNTRTGTATVLIHLNITVDTDNIHEATESAREYCRRHNIPVDDIADIEVL